MNNANNIINITGDAESRLKIPFGTKSVVPVRTYVITIAVNKNQPEVSKYVRYLRPPKNASSSSWCATNQYVDAVKIS